MKESDFEALLRALADAWTAREYDTAITHFADDVFYSDPVRYRFTNSTDLLGFFRDETAEEECTFHDFVFDEMRQVGVAEYTYNGTNRYHGTVWIRLVGERIASWREYQHASDIDHAAFWNIPTG